MIIFTFFANMIWASDQNQHHIADIKNFTANNEICELNLKKVISLRTFDLSGVKTHWIVDPDNLKTSLTQESSLKSCRAVTSPADVSFFSTTPYAKTLTKSNIFSGNIQIQGISRDDSHKDGSFITIDLCPSHKSFDKTFFEKVKSENWPITLSISGLWILKHEEDLRWIQDNIRSDSITWVNHSRNHPSFTDRPLEKNFLLTEGRDVTKEILENEKILIQRGLTPSIFFRYPGLVANEKTLKITKSLGLIPLGADAWISKGQKPIPGSIILLHGNGNDLLGLSRFNRLKNEKKIPLPIRELLSLF